MVYLTFITLLLMACSHHQGQNQANLHMHEKKHHVLNDDFNDEKRDEWQKPSHVLKIIGDVKNLTIQDIGSGGGYFTKYFLQAGAKVIASDVDSTFLAHIQNSFPVSLYPDLTIKKINFNDPLMEQETVDIAFTSNTYHHLDRRVEYLKKIKHGLKIGGRLVVLDFKKNDKTKTFGPPEKIRISLSSVVQEVIQAGFDHLEIYHNEFEHQYLIIAKKVFK